MKIMSSSFLRSTYRRMMKYFLRHWCMEIKCDGNSTKNRSTKKNGQDSCQKSNKHDKQNRRNIRQMTKRKLDKPIKADNGDDGILSDAQLEWEHEEGIMHTPIIYRKSEQDLLDILLTQTPHSSSSTTYIRSPYCPDFEWDNLFDFTL